MEQLSAAAQGGAALIKDTTTRTFMADVIEASMQVPVIVDFWAPWCGPCKQLGPMLERTVTAAKGAVRMVKLNIDENPEIAQQMRIQSIPAVFAFVDGRPFDGFVGAVPESQVKQFVQRLSGLKRDNAAAALDEALEVARQSMTAGDHGAAETIFRQIIQRHPDHVGALVGLARCALAAGDVEDAERIVARLPPEEAKNPEVVSLRSALDLARQAGEAAGKLHQWESRLAADADDHEARLEYAKALVGLGRPQEAVEQLLQMVKRDREWNEQAARKQLVKLFEALGPTDPLTVAARKRLSSILFS